MADIDHDVMERTVVEGYFSRVKQLEKVIGYPLCLNIVQ